MRKLLIGLMAVAALGLGGIASDAHASSVTFVATGPTTITEGDTTTFNVVVTFDPLLISAVFQVDVGPGIGIISANNNLAGTGLGQSNFDLRQANFNPYPGSSCSGLQPTCTVAAPGAPSAGNAGGIALTPIAGGTFTIGSYTVVGNSAGANTVTVRIRPGFEWLDAYYNEVNPTSNTLNITVNPIPEPTTAALIGLGLAGLVAVGRRNRA